VRGLVRGYILQRGARFRESGARLRALINAGKAWVIAYHECVALVTGLPGKEEILADMDKAEVDHIVQRIEAASNVMDNAAGPARAKTQTRCLDDNDLPYP